MGIKFEHGDIENSDVKVGTSTDGGGKGTKVKTGNIKGSSVAIGKGAQAG